MPPMHQTLFSGQRTFAERRDTAIMPVVPIAAHQPRTFLTHPARAYLVFSQVVFA